MASKIYGDPATLKQAREAKPGDPHVYVNMEAIQELPEQFEVQINRVTFDPAKDFDDVGNGTFMPSPRVINDIAEARGIEGANEVKIESIIEEVDICPLMCRPLGSDPMIRRMIVGKRAIKTGRVLNEDGTYRSSDPCCVDYNAWERCLIDWSKEEEATHGYDPKIVKHGKYTAFNKTYEGAYYEKTVGQNVYQYGCKYDNEFKRQRHLAETMKFAQRMADTKARHVVVRVLAGLKTGYTEEDLKAGYFIFGKIRRSREILKLETAADLSARARGITGPGDHAQEMLFGSSAPQTEPEPEFPLDVTPAPQAEPPKTKREHMIGILEIYTADKVVLPADVESVTKVLAWLNKNSEAEKDAKYWPKAIALLKKVEASVPEPGRIVHKIYE